MNRYLIKRRGFLKLAGVTLASGILPDELFAQRQVQRKHVNLLFIMTDQQRWDALGYSGNKTITTPNLDKLASEGAYFENAYSACPVCVPARTSILTGHSIYSTRVLGNTDVQNPSVADLPTFDSVLSEHGYHTEYYGKWHAPYKLTRCYDEPVKPTGREPDSKIPPNVEAFRAWLDKIIPARQPENGQLIDRMSQRPYQPMPIDWRYGMSPGDIEAFGKKYGTMKAGKKQNTNPLTSQAGSYGCLLTGPNASLTAFEGHEALEALKKMDSSKPFSLTCSFGPPHPPFVIPEPYYSMYDEKNMPIPESINDPHFNTPHPPKVDKGGIEKRYRNPDMIRQMKKVYYAMVTQVDEWVGKLLAELERKGLRDNTLVVFTSDHGEMMGDHGTHSKGIMFEGSAHIPLILRLPGVIKAGKHIEHPVSHLDLFATILDYTEMPARKSDGHSLKSLVQNGSFVQDYAVSAWGRQENGGPFMVRSGQWKLIVYANDRKGKRSLPVDALYDLKSDPLEMNNLIGNNPGRKSKLAIANNLKNKLQQWMIRTNNPLLGELKKVDFLK